MSLLIKSIITEFEHKTIVFLTADKITKLLAETKIIMEEDTLMSDYIRILQFDNNFLVQEKSPKNEIILRRFIDEQSARQFVSGRMEIYDKMWDGCGCKINYYS